MYAQAGTATMKVVTSEQYTGNNQKLSSAQYRQQTEADQRTIQ